MSPDDCPWIVETSDETFEADVVTRSYEVPVVLDFWAPWCGPCRKLAPTLEALAREFDGQFVLVKANTDETPGAATALGVSGIPAVFALRNGQLANQFTGVLPESELRRWIQSILPSEVEQWLAEAQTLAASDPAAAEARLRQVLDQDADNLAAQEKLARVILAQGRTQEAQAIIAPLAERGFLSTEGEELKAELALLSGGGAGDLDELRAQVAARPDDHAARLALAQGLGRSGASAEALEEALHLVENDPDATGREARELMVNLFQVLGDDSPLVSEYRRKLSRLLF